MVSFCSLAAFAEEKSPIKRQNLPLSSYSQQHNADSSTAPLSLPPSILISTINIFWDHHLIIFPLNRESSCAFFFVDGREWWEARGLGGMGWSSSHKTCVCIHEIQVKSIRKELKRTPLRCFSTAPTFLHSFFEKFTTLTQQNGYAILRILVVIKYSFY